MFKEGLNIMDLVNRSCH